MASGTVFLKSHVHILKFRYKNLDFDVAIASTVIGWPAAFSKNGPMSPPTQNPNQWHVLDVIVSQQSLVDFSEAQIWQFRRLAKSSRWKLASSLKMILFKKTASTCSIIHSKNSHCAVSRLQVLSELNLVSMEMQIFCENTL